MKVEGNQIQIHFMAGRTITSTIKFNGCLLRFRMSHSGKKIQFIFSSCCVKDRAKNQLCPQNQGK